MNCVQCGAVLAVGCVVCGDCGLPVGLPCGVGPGAVAAAVACTRALTVVSGGSPGASLPTPDEGAQMVLGRHDLSRSPPWVVDVDLTRWLQLAPGEGPPVSRDQAHLARRAGELLITPQAGAPVLHRGAGSPDYAALPPGTAQPVHPGDRLVFGSGGAALVVEAH